MCMFITQQDPQMSRFHSFGLTSPGLLQRNVTSSTMTGSMIWFLLTHMEHNDWYTDAYASARHNPFKCNSLSIGSVAHFGNDQLMQGRTNKRHRTNCSLVWRILLIRFTFCFTASACFFRECPSPKYELVWFRVTNQENAREKDITYNSFYVIILLFSS